MFGLYISIYSCRYCISADVICVIYVLSDNNCIRCIDYATTVVSTLAGNCGSYAGSTNGIGTAARFYSPYGVTVIGGNTVIVADQGMEYITYTKYMVRVFIYGLVYARYDLLRVYY